MPLRRILPLAAAVVLVPASAAHAKGVVSVTACGQDGCRDVSDRIGDADMGALAGDLRRTGRPAPRQVPFIRLRIAYGDPQTRRVLHRQRVLYAPSLKLVAYADPWRWLDVDRRGRTLARRLARGVRPYPAAEMPRGVRVAWPAPATARVVEIYAPGRAHHSTGGAPWWALPGGAAALLAACGLGARGVSCRRSAERPGPVAA
jgi:hypothetical protein